MTDSELLDNMAEMHIKCIFDINDGVMAFGIGNSVIGKHEPYDGDAKYALRRAVERVAEEIKKQVSA
jgi:hypothetical protein